MNPNKQEYYTTLLVRTNEGIHEAFAQKHTHFAAAASHTQTKAAKRVCFLTVPKEIHFFLPSLRCFNFFTHAQPMTDKHFDSSERKQKVVQLDTDDRTPSANSGFAKAGVQCFG